MLAQMQTHTCVDLPGRAHFVRHHPDFAQWLMAQGISSISLNPDTVVETWTALGQAQ